MTVKELAKELNCQVVCMPDGEREVNGGYAGDLLSWVIGRASADCVWVTIMSNVNIVAVATLADPSCIVLSEGVTLEKEKFECTEEAVGTIVEINNKKKKEAYIGIRYEVEEVDFLLKEYIQLKKEPIKFLFIPIWNKKVPVMGNYALGDKIVIKYNPEKPSEAYYPKNESVIKQ